MVNASAFVYVVHDKNKVGVKAESIFQPLIKFSVAKLANERQNQSSVYIRVFLVCTFGHVNVHFSSL